jgi:two-component system, OmpR family, phosphate regulon sensor histidine kinase PhoR
MDASESAPQTLNDLLPVGVLRLDAGRRVVEANARAHALLDTAPGRLIGRTVMETFLDLRIERFLDEGGGTTEVRLGTGEPRTVVLRAAGTSGGQLLVVLEDVSELRRLRQIRTEFIDNLSHELRTPISTISLLAETAAREAAAVGVPERLRDRIAKIEVETGHLAQMVAEILDLARIEGGSSIVPEDDVVLARLAEAAAERLRLFAERAGVRIVVDADPVTPSVRGEEQRIGQVLVNLVHNAVKFSSDGGEVAIRVLPAGDGARVEVIDHGIGIARADRARVFERFYKADRARVRGGGTGLGLAISRHIVAAHGGTIGVESQEGRGSTFWFVLPARPPVAAFSGSDDEAEADEAEAIEAEAIEAEAIETEAPAAPAS